MTVWLQVKVRGCRLGLWPTTNAGLVWDAQRHWGGICSMWRYVNEALPLLAILSATTTALCVNKPWIMSQLWTIVLCGCITVMSKPARRTTLKCLLLHSNHSLTATLHRNIANLCWHFLVTVMQEFFIFATIWKCFYLMPTDCVFKQVVVLV